MNELPIQASRTAAISKKSLRLFGGLLLACLVMGGGVGYYYWRLTRPPVVPAFSLKCNDPAVERVIENAHQEVAKEPNSDKAWGRLGMVLFAHGFFSEAQTCLAQASDLAPHEPRWAYLRALLVLQEDRTAGLDLLEHTAILANSPAFVHARLAEELFENGRFDEAAEHYHQALHSSPNDPRALLGLGRLALQRGDLQESLGYLKKSTVSAPTARVPHALLAEVHFRMGKLAAADQEKRTAAELPEEQYWPDPYYDQATDLQFTVDARIDRASRLLHQGKADETVRALSELIQEYPDAAAPRAALGRVFIYLKDWPAAERALTEATERNKDHLKYQCDLGYVLMRQQRFSEAAECYRKAVSLKPGHALAHYFLAQCLMHSKDQGGAIEELRKAANCKPDFADAFRELGRLLAESGAKAEATAALEQAVQLAPEDQTARRLLQSVH